MLRVLQLTHNSCARHPPPPDPKTRLCKQIESIRGTPFQLLWFAPAKGIMTENVNEKEEEERHPHCL